MVVAVVVVAAAAAAAVVGAVSWLSAHQRKSRKTYTTIGLLNLFMTARRKCGFFLPKLYLINPDPQPDFFVAVVPTTSFCFLDVRFRRR
ncbi:hypothetical protein MUG10_04630 [Xanthomonas prunicola]|uniref:hypothetical protein n=1 Tax=Xanthomonas prunicola TaxID=2053930 RepID=UPI002078BAF0|nr:hypothetical protein [Xanthomonas prunicola]USJ01490.1 hypothetical protein MUG10_04630 [Xanthomonas prunicola]